MWPAEINPKKILALKKKDKRENHAPQALWVALPTSFSRNYTISALSCQHQAAQSYLTLCNPTDCSTSGFPVLHHLPELVQTHVHRVGDAIQPPCPLSSPSPPAFNLSQHLVSRLFTSGGQMLELQLQHQSFQRCYGGQ